MILATHAVVGAIVASRFPSHPVLAFCLAFGTHFILDAIPHWDYELKSLNYGDSDPMKTRLRITKHLIFDVMKVGADFMVGALIAIILLWPANSLFIILIGAVGSATPDFLQFLYFRFQREPLVIIQRFHMWIHADNKMKNSLVLSASLQIVLIIICYLVL
jgi:hypothetical protein